MRQYDEHACNEAASATECTGLVPAMTGAAGEADERALYDVQPVRRPKRRRGK